MKSIFDMCLNSKTEPEEAFESQSVYLLREIDKAKSIARLEFIANVIKADADDKEPYTQDEVILSILRTAWTKRYQQLTG